MAKKSKLTQVAVKIGTAMGKRIAKLKRFREQRSLAKKSFDDIAKQVEALKRQCRKPRAPETRP